MFSYTIGLLLTFFAIHVVDAEWKPVITSNFADPAVLRDEGVWYAYATTLGSKHVQMANSTSLVQWDMMDDPLPDVGKWSDGTNVWAPMVMKIPSGKYVMYYSATSATLTAPYLRDRPHCVGAATADSPSGPFQPADDPIACYERQGGSIDISGFVDSDGSIVTVYKVDGNNAVLPATRYMPVTYRETPIMMQAMKSDGVTPDGQPKEMLNRGPADGPLIEAPALYKSGEGKYFMFFSSNMYNTELYDVSYASSDSLWGPYAKTTTPLLLSSQDTGLVGPGGASLDPHGGNRMVFHGIIDPEPHLKRGMWVCEITAEGNSIRISKAY